MYEIMIAASEQEREAAFTVRKKVFVEEQGVPLSLELDDFDETASHFVVRDGSKAIAAGRIRSTSDAVGKVERVCVLKEYRGKHLGNLMMHALEEHAKETGMSKILLNAQSYAVPFYEKLGYTVTSPEFMDADIPHRAMEKTIDTAE
ncbi:MULTISPECIES: GNAT family N-acetyltransferase [Sporosarcina]|uniref:GNAT family N-acetyltransferase n=1 Tax=Sporosarcina TaxID=1569 RepID=UPI00058D30C0|nr:MULTISPECIES: GNAT family N-acetyltransferase [Sporosarcina]WJY28914.1 GNAT family N-acetyltransferase [Sporosarcina sp. 0.2-SM1T-5]